MLHDYTVIQLTNLHRRLELLRLSNLTYSRSVTENKTALFFGNHNIFFHNEKLKEEYLLNLNMHKYLSFFKI